MKTKYIQMGIDCLDVMYKASIPPIFWKEVVKKYSKTNIQFFLKHKISEKEYGRIKSKYVKKFGKGYKRDLEWMLLDYAPSGDKNDKQNVF